MANNHDVGLWTGAGALLTQATVTNASTPVASTSAFGSWLFEPIVPLVLTPGNYVMGATVFDADNVDTFVAIATAATISQITFAGNRVAFGSGLLFPASTFGAPFNDGYFGPNASILQVPEPATLALVVIALAALCLSRRKRANHLRH